MTVETLTCPYCNASLAIQADWSAGQRIVCPRCGDTFPLRFDDSITGRLRPQQSSATAITTSTPTQEVSLPPRWPNRLIAGVVIGVMLLMAGGGLAFMLLTQEQRRAYDTGLPPRRPGRQRSMPEADSVPSIVSISPDKLAALGYLPPSVNFLLAARIPELLASPIGAQLLHDPLKLGESSFRLENLPRWLDFRPEDIDHLVFAARIDSTVPPPFYVVLRTAQPYDPEQLRQRLKGTRISRPSKKTLFSFRIPRPDIPLNAWCADERTVVLALFADQLDSLPAQPVEDLQQLSEELRMLLKQRREPVAPVWIAGHSSRDWSKTSAALFLNRMKKEDLTKLASLRTFGIFLVPTIREDAKDNTLAVKGVFSCKDKTGAQGLEEHFHALGGPNTDLKTALEGPWLTLQLQTSPDFLTRVLKK